MINKISMGRDPSILVTGGSGFIGRHLIAELRARYPESQITVVDRVPPSTLEVEFVQADISDLETLRPLLKKSDYVFHLAALAGVDLCQREPELVRKTNFEDTKAFIDVCAQEQIKKVLFVSSSEIYGNSPDVPYREDAKPVPVSLYGEYKAAIESYLRETTSGSDMQVTIVRPFNVYGPAQRIEFVVSIYYEAARKGEPIVVFGDGEQIRCFTYVGEAVRGFADAFEHQSPYEIFNIGNNKEVTMNELAELIRDMVSGSRSQIVHREYGRDGVRLQSLEIRRRAPFVEKAKNLLGFEADMDIVTGIHKILEHEKA